MRSVEHVLYVLRYWPTVSETFVAGEILIRFRDSHSRLGAAAQSLETEVGLQPIDTNRSLGVHHYALPTDMTVAEALRRFRDDDRVEFVEPITVAQVWQT